jgi:hypothetical protein
VTVPKLVKRGYKRKSGKKANSSRKFKLETHGRYAPQPDFTSSQP